MARNETMGNIKKTDIVINAKDFFRSTVQDALKEKRLSTNPFVQDYLSSLLQYYMHASNLYDLESENGRRQRSTLAELYLTATSGESGVRVDLLKKLGDVSLYVSGFFGESLHRTVVDVEYYANMGGIAYATLSSHVKEDAFKDVYNDFSLRFMDYVEVLTLISKKTRMQNDNNLLLLFDRYVSSGSQEAEKSLIEKGLLPPTFTKKVNNQ